MDATLTTIEEAADWTLGDCCNTSQIVFISCFLAYLVINGILFRCTILKPLKLIAVFIHEMSHATACWLTCGKVTGIEVYDNEGGVTKYIGGAQICVIPAGYLGCSFWGMVFIILSSDLIAATVAASGFTLALIIALFYSPNRTMVWLNLGFAAGTAALVLLQWLVPGDSYHFPFLCFVVLYYGTFIGSFGVYDIWDDTISRSIEGSDSHACHEMCPICAPRCIGVIWAFMAIVFMATGVYFALLWMGAHGSFD